jgi:arginyl-tRNA synthetase
MVALSPACCRELGIGLNAEDRQKTYIEVSGRKGLGVKADDLIDKLLEKSMEEVTQRQKDLSEEKRKEIAEMIAVGALRYFMLKYTRNSVIAFDFEEALSFEGETGPYLQYSVVRSNNIFRKLASEQSDEWKNQWISIQSKLWDSPLTRDLLEDHEIWSLLTSVAQIDQVIAQSIDSLEVAGVAKHAFSLAQQLNLFYHKHHIISESNPETQVFYLTVVDTARRGLLVLFDLLGIEVPERM